MTTFSFSTGNPSNLTGGATASMTDISGSLTDVKTFLNGGSITDTNVSAGGLTYTSLASTVDSYYKPIERGYGISLGGGTTGAAGTFVFHPMNGLVLPSDTSFTPGLAVFYLDPADYPSGSRTRKLRLQCSASVNAVATGILFTFGLYPVTAVGGVAGAITITLGAVVAGSTAAIAPTLSTVNPINSSEFNFPASAGAYALGVVLGGAVAANSTAALRVALQFRAT